ncbi:MAG: tetratricopeptide repeat protein [Chloroflexota bacterium]
MEDEIFRPAENVFLNAARLLRKAGEFRDALKLVKKAIINLPETGNVFIEAGKIYLALKDDENAEKSFLKALSISDKSPEALKNLGFLRMSQSNIPEAVDYLTRYLRNQGWEDVETLKALSNLDVQAEDKEKVLNTLEDAWNSTLDPEIGYLCANQLRLAGRSEEALPIIDLLVKNTPSALNFNMAGIINHDLKNYERGISMYQKAIEFLDDMVESQSELQSDDYDPQLGNLYAVILGNLSGSFLAAGKNEEALAEAEKALDLFQNNSYPWKAKINALKALEKFQEVSDTCLAAFEHNEQNNFLSDNDKEEFVFLRATVLRDLIDKIRKENQPNLEQETNSIRESALGILQQGMEAYPHNPNFIFEIGRIYKALEKYDQAVKAFEKSFQKIKELPYKQAENYTEEASEYFLLLHLNGQGDDAWDKCKSLTGFEPEILVIRIFFLLDSGQYDYKKYQATWEKIIPNLYEKITRDIEDTFILKVILWFRWSQKNLKECIVFQEKMLELFKNNYDRCSSLSNLGFFYIMNAEYEKAGSYLEEGITIDIESNPGDDNGIYRDNNLGLTTFLDGKLGNCEWSNPEYIFGSHEELGYFGDPKVAARYNLASLALFHGDIDNASKWVNELLVSYETSENNRQYLDLLFLSLAAYRKEIKSARAAWANYLLHKDERMSVEYFAKAYPDLYSWLTKE